MYYNTTSNNILYAIMHMYYNTTPNNILYAYVL